MEELKDKKIEENDIGIEDLNIEEITKPSKKKKIIKIVSRTLVGIISVGLLVSLVPNIEYQIALQKGKSDKRIEVIMKSKNTSQSGKAKEVFEYAIESNNKISDNMKKKIKKAFNKRVISKFGNEFTDKTIYNMYAVASTEKVKETSSFAKKHGWWSGDYNSYFNTFTLENDDEALIAHEQLHAILKRGLFGTGLTTGINGYGINEGGTSYFATDDSYSAESYNLDALGLCFGYKKVFKYYVNSDLDGLKKEISKYIGQEKTDKLISNMDRMTFTTYLKTFLIKNSLSNEDPENFYNEIIEMQQENNKYIREIFENKYGINIKDSNKGMLLNDILRNTEDEGEFEHYKIVGTEYVGNGRIIVRISSDLLDLPSHKVKILPEKLNSGEAIAKALNIDENLVNGYEVANDGDGTSTITLSDLSIPVEEKNIDDFKYKDILKQYGITDKDLNEKEEKENSSSNSK